MRNSTSRTTRFASSPGGAIAVGRRRLGIVLLGLGAAMTLLSIAVWMGDRKLPALLCLGTAFVLWTAWRMSGDLDPLWLELEPDRLILQLRRQRVDLPLFTPRGRRLDDDERRHVERLASRGGIVAGTGGFDSHRLGEFNLYASDLENAVLVETGDSRVVVTPDDADAFLEALGGA